MTKTYTVEIEGGPTMVADAGTIELVNKLSEQLRDANVANTKLRARAEWAVEVAAETGTEDCGCCGANWLDHPHEFCT